MPNYVCLFDWTDQGVRNVAFTVGRVDKALEMAGRKYEVKFGQIYWTVGAHDLVGVLEAPDDKSLAAFLLDLSSLGNVRVSSMRAYDRGEMSEIVDKLG